MSCSSERQGYFVRGHGFDPDFVTVFKPDHRACANSFAKGKKSGLGAGLAVEAGFPNARPFHAWWSVQPEGPIWQFPHPLKKPGREASVSRPRAGIRALYSISKLMNASALVVVASASNMPDKTIREIIARAQTLIARPPRH